MRDLSKGKILVTGGAGFIGSALVRELNSRGLENLLICDRLGKDYRFRNMIPLRFDDYIDADELLSRISSNDMVLKDIETIFHLGACAITTESDCDYLIKNNFEYTKALAKFAMARDCRFVYASSAATYGNGSRGMSDDDEHLYDLRPLNMYGYSKHLFDCYAKGHGFLDKIYGLKYFNVFGPNENHKGTMISMVRKAYDQIIGDGVVKLFKSHRPDYKDGEQLRDFIYVKDAVDITIFLAMVDSSMDGRSTGGLFNVGSGKAHSWIELVTPVFEALGRPVNIDFVAMPEHLIDIYQYYTKADLGKLRRLGYAKTITSLGDAVADYVKNYIEPDRIMGE
ncbi:MAG: ADP-glyceromanno-heptose 6-epimerase [Puniceicoccales bacterium]|jgi:ADP-L-glycero-D-manno-heptose 6-epimerase|nr:ADP-glyceromanno-heptose 6-epimerase [Puniceicoccales bacterium]